MRCRTYLWVMELKMRCKCAIAHAHNDIWKSQLRMKFLVIQPGRQDPHWSNVENLSTCLWVQSRGQLPPGKCLLPSFWAKTWGFLHIRMYSYIPLWPLMWKQRLRFHMQAALQPFLSDWCKCLCKLKAVLCGSGKSARCDMDWGHCYMDCYCIYPVHKTLKHNIQFIKH